MAKKSFKGFIKRDTRDSKPERDRYTPTWAPERPPNTPFEPYPYDDIGLAGWPPFGGRINQPTLRKLADKGLMSPQQHTTALCSPTRLALLTGRNHQVSGFVVITEATIDANQPAIGRGGEPRRHTASLKYAQGRRAGRPHRSRRW